MFLARRFIMCPLFGLVDIPWGSIFFATWVAVLFALFTWDFVLRSWRHLAAHPAQVEDVARAIAWTLRELPALVPQVPLRRFVSVNSFITNILQFGLKFRPM